MRVVCNKVYDCLHNSIYGDKNTVCYHRIIHNLNSAGDKSECNCCCHLTNTKIKCVPFQNVIRKEKLKKIKWENLK